MCNVISFEVISFEINISYKAVFPHDQKNQDEKINILRTKRAFKMK